MSNLFPVKGDKKNRTYEKGFIYYTNEMIKLADILKEESKDPIVGIVFFTVNRSTPMCIISIGAHQKSESADDIKNIDIKIYIEGYMEFSWRNNECYKTLSKSPIDPNEFFDLCEVLYILLDDQAIIKHNKRLSDSEKKAQQTGASNILSNTPTQDVMEEDDGETEYQDPDIDPNTSMY